jgi:hypothetical protein
MGYPAVDENNLDAKTTTVFSSASFCKIWAEAYGTYWRRTGSRNDLGVIYTKTKRMSLLNYELSPYGLYWGSNVSTSESYRSAIEIVRSLSRNWKCQSVTWNFRYDAHEQLESALNELKPANCSVAQSYTHVIPIEGVSYDQLVSRRIKPVTRRQITQGITKGLEIRKITSNSDLEKHETIYKAWATKKGVLPKPPFLFRKLALEMDNSVSFLGAFIKEDLIATILVFQDCKEWFYWHGIRDAQNDNYFASDVLLSYIKFGPGKARNYL